MTINSKIRLSILASVVALAAAAPAAFAQNAGTWQGGWHTDPETLGDVAPAHHSAETMKKMQLSNKIVPNSTVAVDAGTWQGGWHTDPATLGDVPPARHSAEAMTKMQLNATVANQTVANQSEQSIQLKDGSTAHVFADGKMGMESKFGQPVYMEPGHVMATENGKTITMIGNEIGRVNALLTKTYQPG